MKALTTTLDKHSVKRHLKNSIMKALTTTLDKHSVKRHIKNSIMNALTTLHEQLPVGSSTGDFVL